MHKAIGSNLFDYLLTKSDLARFLFVCAVL